MVGGIFQIYIVQITRKYIYETNGLIISMIWSLVLYI